MWKDNLTELLAKYDYVKALHFMESTILDSPSNVDAYLNLHYVLDELLMEHHKGVNEEIFMECCEKQRRYYRQAYGLLYNNADYLFYTGVLICWDEFFYDVDYSVGVDMMHKSSILNPKNNIYDWGKIVGGGEDHNRQDNMRSYYDNVIKNTSYYNEIQNHGPVGLFFIRYVEWSLGIRDNF